MPWITPTEDDILTRISSSELEAVRAAVLGDGQADPVLTTLDQVIDEVRGYVSGNRENVLGLDGTIPDKLLGVTLSIFVPLFLARAAGLSIDPEGERAKARDQAYRTLKAVASGEFRIEEPTEKDDATHFVQQPKYSGRNRDYTRDRMDGI
jgi:hypothetical protein